MLSLERRRKFAIALVALVMSFVLALIKVVDGANWVAVTGLIVGLYAGSEALEGGLAARNGASGREERGGG